MPTNEQFPQYTTDYISGVMSLRKPQTESLKILENILQNITLRKGTDTRSALEAVHSLYPTCTDFERNFISLTFALATGVGKTRLMGAFIAYLYTQHNIRSFFVVAPNTTIFEKLKRELSDSGDPKYVFRGLGCFASPPEIITDDDYRNKQLNFRGGPIRIFVYNIDKFNKEDANMRKTNEMLGDSFFRTVSGLPDLVLIMDESHHYRAEKGAAALNDLQPLLGLELTATPLVSKGGKQIPFKNVVYEYPLSRAIEDGFTRTPFAVTRADVPVFDFGDEQLDKLMLNDGIACHENAKTELNAYAENYGKPRVKPFMLVVCKDTAHAQWVYDYICSEAFRGGKYRGKTIMIHSKQKGTETEANTRLLLGVESPDNPVEIVIHVNMLKEGWDVNNLYTIVPLRTAASSILREQMVGRGLRLPYGERTGVSRVDAVMLTAHDKFNEILAQAQMGDSIFKAGNILHAEDLAPVQSVITQPVLPGSQPGLQEAEAIPGLPISEKSAELTRKSDQMIRTEVFELIQNSLNEPIAEEKAQEIAEKVANELREEQDYGEIFSMRDLPLVSAALKQQVEKVYDAAMRSFIPIPHIKITDNGQEDLAFSDFELDLTPFTQEPVANEILIQNLLDPRDRQRSRGNYVDFEGYQPEKVILADLRNSPEIDYEENSDLIFQLINSLCNHFRSRYGTNGLQNIVMMYHRTLARELYTQMMKHSYTSNGMLIEEVDMVRRYNLKQQLNFEEQADLYGTFRGDIRNVLFTGIQKGVFDTAKFDSVEGELSLARLLDVDPAVQKWLRPNPNEFNIFYDHGNSRYEPDFVVETHERIYLVEVKGEDKLRDPAVLKKKERGIQYCTAASRWARANGEKEWQYLFIPAGKIYKNSTFPKLAEMFKAL